MTSFSDTIAHFWGYVFIACACALIYSVFVFVFSTPQVLIPALIVGFMVYKFRK